jgi:hypothetical protein
VEALAQEVKGMVDAKPIPAVPTPIFLKKSRLLFFMVLGF